VRRRLPRTIASAVGARSRITIRAVSPADDEALESLRALAGSDIPAGRLLAAEADGEIVAVVDEQGHALSDPFRVTVDVVEILRLRAAQLQRLAA
jgi:predicted ATP-grasp superfamily ATP-dependent carboligase